MKNKAKIFLDKQQLICAGEWCLAELANLEKSAVTLTWPSIGTIKIDCSNFTKLDITCSWLLFQIQKK